MFGRKLSRRVSAEVRGRRRGALAEARRREMGLGLLGWSLFVVLPVVAVAMGVL